jgi:hypothetical protein
MFQRACALTLAVFGSAALLAAGQKTLSAPSPDQIPEIVKKFVQKETDFSSARESYTYQQHTKMEEVDPPGGGFEILEEVTFDDRDRRTSHVLRAPVTTLQNIVMTHEDEEDYRNVMPFVMTNDTRPEYDVTYVGHEPVDEITCYVFSVKPKELTKDRKRYFEGQIWVDDQDLQIVKTYGRATGHLGRGEDQQFPKFETYRQQIDGKYWFPVYTSADDTLRFKDGQSQRIKVVIHYDHYKQYQFKTQSTIKYGEVGSGSTQPNPPANPQQAPPQ